MVSVVFLTGTGELCFCPLFLDVLLQLGAGQLFSVFFFNRFHQASLTLDVVLCLSFGFFSKLVFCILAWKRAWHLQNIIGLSPCEGQNKPKKNQKTAGSVLWQFSCGMSEKAHSDRRGFLD